MNTLLNHAVIDIKKTLTCIFAVIFNKNNLCIFWQEGEEEKGISTFKILHSKNICNRDPNLYQRDIKNLDLQMNKQQQEMKYRLLKKGPLIDMDNRP